MTTWIKLHDNFWENPKVLAAGEDAALLYVQGLSYCSRNLTDGRIPKAALRSLTGRKEAPTLARTLVREGLWSEVDTGWKVHDYLKVQRSREQVEGERDKARERARNARKPRSVRANFDGTSGEVTADVREPDTETDTEPDTNPPTPLPPAGRDELDFEHHPIPKIPDEVITNAEQALEELKRQMRPSLYAVPTNPGASHA